MRVRSFAATMMGIAALLVARDGVAGQVSAANPDRGSLVADVRAVGQGLWFLASAGLNRLGYRIAARAVSRHIVATADNSFDACLAQADVTWQTASEETAISEWNKLDHLVKEVERDPESSAVEIATCQNAYRRVSGDLLVWAMSVTYCGPTSVVRRRLEKVRPVFAAYLAAVQPKRALQRTALARRR